MGEIPTSGAALDADLGPLESEHVHPPTSSTLLTVTVLASGFVVFLAGLIINREGTAWGFCVSSIGGLLLILGGMSLHAAVRDRDLLVRVHRGGLLQVRGGTTQAIHWGSIISVNHGVMHRQRVGIPIRTTHLCTLVLADGRRVQYSDATLEHVEQLCQAVESHTLHPLLGRISTQLSLGQTVPFGRLHATPQGIGSYSSDEILPWDAIDGLVITGDRVVVEAQGQSQTLALTSEVDNVHVVAALIEHAHSARSATAQHTVESSPADTPEALGPAELE